MTDATYYAVQRLYPNGYRERLLGSEPWIPPDLKDWYETGGGVYCCPECEEEKDIIAGASCNYGRC